ncbi:MAG: hypothetical protein AAF135_09670 [Bacteroidota bacterium]
MIRALLLFTLFSGGIHLWAQRTILNSDPGLVVSYFGDGVTHPGLKVGLDYPIYIKETRKAIPTNKGGFNLTQSSQLFAGSGLGYYTFPRDHGAIFLQVEGGFRYLRNQSNLPPIAWRLDATLGMVFAIYTGGNGADPGSGSFRSTLSGQGLLMPTIGLAIGQDIKTSNLIKPISWHIKPNLWLYRFFSSESRAFLALEVGLTVRGLFLPSLPKKIKMGQGL